MLAGIRSLGLQRAKMGLWTGWQTIWSAKTLQGDCVLETAISKTAAPRFRYQAYRATAQYFAASSATPGSEVHSRADVILRFWLGDNYRETPPNAGPGSKVSTWYSGGPEFDKVCQSNFRNDLEAAAAGKLNAWDKGYNGLALVILMDQLSRNIHRGSPRTYELDSRALELANRIEDSGNAVAFPAIHRIWLYMPLMHSEEICDLNSCVERFEALLMEAKQLPESEELQKMLRDNIDFAHQHKDVIAKWGRYPHRNAILGRQDTPDEAEGLAAGTIAKF